MIKENQKYLNRIQIALDLSLVAVSMAISYWGRFVLLDGARTLSQMQMAQITAGIMVLYGFIYSQMGLYRPKRKESLFKEIMEIARSNMLGIILLMVGLYFFKIVDFSRGQLLLFFFMNVLLMISERLAVRLILRYFRSQGFNLKHCLVIGANEISDDFIDH